MKWRNFNVCCTSVAILASLLVPRSVPASAAPPEHTAAQSIQFNMYGNEGLLGPEHYNEDVAEHVLGRLQARPNIYTISLNEICFSQWSYLYTNYFAGKDFVALAQWAHPNLNTACGGFGNVVLVRGTSATWWSAGTFSTQGSSTNHGEHKGWACLTTNYFGISGCAAHTQGADHAKANVQIGQLASVVTPLVQASHALWVAGDFNLRPWQPSTTSWLMTWYYVLFREGDYPRMQSPAKRSTNDYGSPIDYVFRRPATTAGAAYISGTMYSDHHGYQMYN